MSWVTPPSPASGGASSVTVTVQVLTLSLNATLTGERKFSPNEGLTATDGGAGGGYSLEMTSRVIEQSGVSVTTSTTITLQILRYIIQPNMLGTDKTLRLTAFGWHRNANNNVLSISCYVALGATTMFNDFIGVAAPSTPLSSGWMMHINLTAENSANAQVLSGLIIAGLASLGATTGIGEFGTDEISNTTPLFGAAAENSATTLTFEVMMMPAATPVTSQGIVKKYHVLRLI